MYDVIIKNKPEVIDEVKFGSIIEMENNNLLLMSKCQGKILLTNLQGDFNYQTDLFGSTVRKVTKEMLQDKLQGFGYKIRNIFPPENVRLVLSHTPIKNGNL